MYTDACVAAMGLDDPAAAGLVEHVEAFEGVGEIVAWVRDLHAAWAAELDRARIVVERRTRLGPTRVVRRPAGARLGLR